MTAVDEIQAAIVKLTELRGLSTQPVESQHWLQGMDRKRYESPREIYTGPEAEGSADIAICFNPHDAELIVTLHRTIDAQLDTLRTARGFYGAALTGPEVATLFAEHALILARAINGARS